MGRFSAFTSSLPTSFNPKGEQGGARGLLDEPIEGIVDNVFEIGEEAINRVSGWRFVVSAVVPDEAVLEFSRNRTCPVNILVVTVQKATEEAWRLVDSCSPAVSGSEHVGPLEKLEGEMLE